MKKLLGILVLGLILFAGIADAKRTNFRKGQIYEGEISWMVKLNWVPSVKNVIQ